MQKYRRLSKPHLAGLSTRERKYLSTLLLTNRKVLYSFEASEILGLNSNETNRFLSRLSKKGWLNRIKRGAYLFVPLESSFVDPFPEEVWQIAMELFKPCYLSGWTSAEHWDFTEQIFNTVMVITSAPQRQSNHKIAGINFKTRQVHENRLFGIKKLWIDNNQIFIADRHKTIIDILDAPEIGGGGQHTLKIVKNYLRAAEVNLDTILKYAIIINRGTLYKRIGYSFEKYGNVTNAWLSLIKSKISRGISNFDPSGSRKGKIDLKWSLRINLPDEE